MHKVVGISGVAGAGKDLFYSLLSNQINSVKYALADDLKKEVRETSLRLYGVDSTNCSRGEKDYIRPFLVSHGTMKRNKTDGTHWTKLLTKKIKEDCFEYLYQNKINLSDRLVCVTDIRYDHFPKDEVFWLKNELNGILVHISAFSVKNGKKIIHPPINSEEKKQDPLLKSKADYILEWEYITKDDETRDQVLGKAVKDFLKWLKKGPVTKRTFLLTGP